MVVDTSKWSGEGEFTQTLVDELRRIDRIDHVRVEDAPASRSDAAYNFISNEIYLRFTTRSRVERTTRFVVIPTTRTVLEKTMTVEELERTLTATPEIGPPDYSDARMLQYLKTERIVPPYQTRGYKLVELVRIYEL